MWLSSIAICLSIQTIFGVNEAKIFTVNTKNGWWCAWKTYRFIRTDTQKKPNKFTAFSTKKSYMCCTGKHERNLNDNKMERRSNWNKVICDHHHHQTQVSLQHRVDSACMYCILRKWKCGNATLEFDVLTSHTIWFQFSKHTHTHTTTNDQQQQQAYGFVNARDSELAIRFHCNVYYCEGFERISI